MADFEAKNKVEQCESEVKVPGMFNTNIMQLHRSIDFNTRTDWRWSSEMRSVHEYKG